MSGWLEQFGFEVGSGRGTHASDFSARCFDPDLFAGEVD